MPEVSDVVGIGLAGGQGMRARPLTLKAPGYLRSKAAMSFLGRRLIRWVMTILSSEGIKDYYVIAHGKENRYQIKVMIGYGEGFGVDVKYSPVKYDALSTGSADSALRLMEYWDISQPALVFPTDSVIDFDLAPMVETHVGRGAVATIAAMMREPDEVAEKYGVMLTDGDGRRHRVRREAHAGRAARTLPRGDRRGLPAAAADDQRGVLPAGHRGDPGA